MSTLMELDRDLATAVLGRSRGRPSISRRAGVAVGRTFGISSEAGTDLFHGALILGGTIGLFAFIAKVSR